MSNVLKLARAMTADIPAVLRSIADEMEKGTYGKTVAGVVVLESDEGVLEIFGGAQADLHRTVSLLAGAQQIMIQRTYGRSTEV